MLGSGPNCILDYVDAQSENPVYIISLEKDGVSKDDIGWLIRFKNDYELATIANVDTSRTKAQYALRKRAEASYAPIL